MREPAGLPGPSTDLLGNLSPIRRSPFQAAHLGMADEKHRDTKMKSTLLKSILTATVLCLADLGITAQPLSNSTNTTCTLAWSWPSNAFSIVNEQMRTVITNPVAWPALTNFAYRIYSTSSLQGTNTTWTPGVVIYNPPASTNADGSVWLSAK